ncbi:hypothetical protein [Pedobacter frigoris]|uniref:hypothetical protein n=1 Tax=Pedobacter frigoris TaxID=2571272 RepID=UPI0029315DFD|nr:hypothetical protein [Pedobacter frigoris]
MKNKNIAYAALAVLMLTGACKKNNASGEGENASSGSLINESTGWKKVGTIPFIHAVYAFAGSNAITPYDLTVVDNQLALLYSEDYKMTGVQGTLTYKVKFTPGSAIPASIPLKRGGWAFFYSTRFIPGTFTPVYMKMEGSNYTVSIYTDDALIAGNNTDYTTPAIRPINWYGDGGLTMSVPGGNKQAYVLSYTFPNTGNFSVTENVWRLDPTNWKAFDALRLSGGEINQFLVSTEGAKVYFSILKNNPDFISRTGMEQSFFTLTRQEIPGLNAANFTSANMIIASTVVNDKYTVLIGETAPGGAGLGFNKVHCYQWQKGTTQFTKLYGDIALPADIGSSFMSRAAIGTRPVEGADAAVKFTPDYSAYMLYNSIQSSKYTALAIVNAQGAKTVGKYATADYPNQQYEQIGLATCQYYNGAYYAVVYQKREDLFSINDPRFRLEIVKLNP